MNYLSVYIEHESQSLDKPFTYSSTRPVLPGCRVQVGFGRQHLTGIVWECSQTPPDFKTRPIEKILDHQPVLNDELSALAWQISQDTITPLMRTIKSMLPEYLKPKSDSRHEIEEEVFLLDPAWNALLITEWNQSLQDTRALQEEFPVLSRKNQSAETEDEKMRPEMKQLTRKQQEFLQKLHFPVTAAAARKLSVSMSKTLLEKGVLLLARRTKLAGTLPPMPYVPGPALNGDQKRALQILEGIEQGPALLYGVTGSGKTEVFFHLMEKALARQKQVLVLVPEISLTPMMKKRLASRFSVPIFDCHSQLSQTEMQSVRAVVASDRPCIVVGTRKSVFLPFSHLGLIIMDEEHDGSYKQSNAPRYHARDAVLFRAKWHQCLCLMASATPSLESYARTLTGHWPLATLPRRAAGENAAIHLVDLKTVSGWEGFSPVLLKAMQQRLDRQEKSLLLLNRRGFYPSVRCPSCKDFVRCQDCDLPLSYHKQENALVCHTCGRRYPANSACPACGNEHLQLAGQGTERLEEMTQTLFPTAKIVRMDRDTTRMKGAHARLLDKFEQDGDILMGTQMISKGLDYEKVTLAGILSIDSLLARPSWRASEMAYQLAEQAAGRAGRGKYRGDVYIQTFSADHYVLKCIQNHDYLQFFKTEMQYRKAGAYPPYTYMASVIFSDESEEEAWKKADAAADYFAAGQMNVLGPVLISKRKQIFRARIVLRSRNDAALKAILWKFVREVADNKTGRVEIDVHPMDLEE